MRPIRLCPDCGGVSSHHPHCPNAPDDDDEELINDEDYGDWLYDQLSSKALDSSDS